MVEPYSSLLHTKYSSDKIPLRSNNWEGSVPCMHGVLNSTKKHMLEVLTGQTIGPDCEMESI